MLKKDEGRLLRREKQRARERRNERRKLLFAWGLHSGPSVEIAPHIVT